MEGKFRKRANTVWCPKPQEEKIITQEDICFFGEDYITAMNYKIGSVYSKAKSKTGWTNMDNCSNCPHLEEYHIEELGVFCTYPKVL